MSKTVQVDLVADFVCPWCWLGHRYWLDAIERAKDITVETVWRPYQLDPTLDAGGAPYRDYMKAKFAGQDSGHWTAMREHLEQAAPTAGIRFRFDDMQVRPNTSKAHRLMRWATGQGKADDMADALFQAYFADLKDIGDPAILADLAGQTGLDQSVVAGLLDTDRDAASVWEEEVFYRKLGVSGVPCFIFNGRFAVSGAEDPETLAKAIREAADLPPLPDEDEEPHNAN